MPNHVANRITGPSLAEIRELLRGDRAVDFNRLIPRPASFTGEPHSGVIDAAKFACKDWPDTTKDGLSGMTARLELANMQRGASPLGFSDADWAEFVRCLENRRAHGFYYWYEWNCEHWGTKWNAYSIEDRGDSLYFETAWAFPEPIMHALIAALPSVEFEWAYADEDHGRNLGIWTRCDGVLAHSLPDGDAEAWAMRLHGMSDAEIAQYRAEIEADRAAVH